MHNGQLMLVRICVSSSLWSLSQTACSAFLEVHAKDPASGAQVEMRPPIPSWNNWGNSPIYNPYSFFLSYSLNREDPQVPRQGWSHNTKGPGSLNAVMDRTRSPWILPLPLAPTSPQKAVWCKQEISPHDVKPLTFRGYLLQLLAYPTNTTLHYKKLISTKN